MEKLDYPKSILEFVARFHNDEICLDYLIMSRWPNGFVCPVCEFCKGWWLKQYCRYECSQCHRQTSALAGTLMHRSHLPIRYWFWSAYLVSTGTPGSSAVQLQRQLGLNNDETVWYLLQRLRHGMVRTNREPLSGVVEADETHVGGTARGFKGRGVRNAPNKSLIAGAVEIVTFINKEGKQEEKAGRLRLKVLQSGSATEIKAFLNACVSPGSAIKSDGWPSYSLEAMQGYQHVPVVQGKPENAGTNSPHIHRVFGNLKTWLAGTHHGVSPKYLQAYLDEFVFRFNRRKHPMAAFRSLLGITSSRSPLPLKSLTQP